MWMILRVVRWELELTSWKDADHQQQAALSVLTLFGAAGGKL